MTPPITELRPEILKALGLPETEVFTGFGEDYPECLCLVVLRNVGPGPMDKVVKLLHDRVRKGARLRLCANIVEKKHRDRFKGLDFESAWTLSWDVNCATVRWE